MQRSALCPIAFGIALVACSAGTASAEETSGLDPYRQTAHWSNPDTTLGDDELSLTPQDTFAELDTTEWSEGAGSSFQQTASRSAASARCNSCKSACGCDSSGGSAKPNPAASAYKNPFYKNDFSYLEDPCYSGALLGECLKRNWLGCHTVFDLGGQYRARLHNEHNMRRLGLTGVSDDFLLHRTRLYANLQVGSRLRLFGEYIDATSEFQNVPPRPIEKNRSDAINIFADYMITEGADGQLWGRVGRQEFLFGAQRFVSPLDWANTRRTFEGATLFWKSGDWRVDGFWTRPVFPDPKNFDSVDHQQEFYGLWSTYTGDEGVIWDLFWLGKANYENPFPAGGSSKLQTCGGRVLVDQGPVFFELTGAYQFGEFGAFNHSAGMYTVGAGLPFPGLPWSPTLWGYYDWASGDEVLGNGFDQLFPLAHKYLGYMDFFARRNIQDANLLLSVSPADRLKMHCWWHVFHLENSRDVPYNVNNTPFTTTPGGDTYLGQELDFLAAITLTPRTAMVLGYSHFFTGDWYRTNPTPGLFTGDADFVYTQFHVNF